ncbi:hypothetical protein PVAP13_1NG027836 [Panicum virgatum]|uniref:Uncharacterized protein n=1 Tax=Panicum virgatum TaxID=38727 RepID=A0A8T0WUJ5_PANVG|nr:hypothetical protein PVAP13_1NG027836 [Panicum virgatum]
MACAATRAFPTEVAAAPRQLAGGGLHRLSRLPAGGGRYAALARWRWPAPRSCLPVRGGRCAAPSGSRARHHAAACSAALPGGLNRARGREDERAHRKIRLGQEIRLGASRV